jgi:hypothetical protein
MRFGIKEESRLRISVDRVFRRIFGPMSEEAIEG